jgi:hypothetical protein
MPGGWISIPGWRRFQHYDPAKRQPPWIKAYLELLDDEDYLALAPGARSLLHGIWLMYASSRCQVRFDARSISARLRLRVTTSQLVSLSDAGWIAEVASKTLAVGYHDASVTLASRAPAHSREAEAEVEGQQQTLDHETLQAGKPELHDGAAAGLPAEEPEEDLEPDEPVVRERPDFGQISGSVRAELLRLRAIGGAA